MELQVACAPKSAEQRGDCQRMDAANSEFLNSVVTVIRYGAYAVGALLVLGIAVRIIIEIWEWLFP